MSERLPRLLAIDDDRSWLSQIPLILEDEVEVTCCDSIDQGLIAVESGFYDIVFLDLNFDGDARSGLDVFRSIAALDHSTDVIVLSGETDPARLVQIINAGVSQFIPKPSSATAIREAVRSTLRKRELRFHALNLACGNSSRRGSPHLIGSSAAMDKLRGEVALAVESGAKDILLTGETGTGKEVVARAIATMADPAKRLIPIHCGAIIDGLAESELFGHVRGAFTGADRDRVSAFEAAGGGFVFLDEIGEMPLHQQAKLLRVLQERKVVRVGSNEERPASFRCISATNVDILRAIETRRFREDLYYRVAKFQISMPSLRDRPEDIPELAHYFIGLLQPNRQIDLTDEAVQLLQSYAWPGNVRQLQAVVESVISRNPGLSNIREKEVLHVLPDLSRSTRSPSTRALGKQGVVLVTAEKKKFQKALIDARGDRSEAAKLLNISRATFFRRAKELGLVNSPRN
jgi:DNA-binding NtrC family response regulator